MSEQPRKDYPCPECGTEAHRSHRRPHERVIALIVPLRRYRCGQCGWSGLRLEWHRPRLQLEEGWAVRLVLILFFLLLTVAIAVWLTR